MSGHSKWSTIKRKKEVTDQARGKLFSRLGKAISIAVKTGGGGNPDSNPTLRVAVDNAKAANMPKANIERAIKNASEVGDVEELTYEGFGPEGFGVMVIAVSDNRNRTAQEIKTLFDRGGGTLASPGAVSFNFEPKGMIMVANNGDLDEQMLQLIDLGAEEVEPADDGLEVLVGASNLYALKDKFEAAGFNILSTELIQNPKTLQSVENAQKALSFLEALNAHDDVQSVYANLDISE